MNWHISCVNSYMKLYIISNRLPVKVTKEDETFVFSRSEGGLATGLDSLQISYEKHWIGWPGICVDNEESKEERSTEISKSMTMPCRCMTVVKFIGTLYKYS